MNPERLKNRIGELGLTQAEVARRAKISPGYVHLLVRGERGRRIGAEVLTRLSKALDVEPDFFCTTSPHVKKEVVGG
jgi:transcriptional regulator with XRE-family HTH domain